MIGLGTDIGITGLALRGSAAASAPMVTASDALDGRVLTITRGGLGGSPTPTVDLTALTLDAGDVLANAVVVTPGRVWTYTAPEGPAQTVAWTITATNSEGSDTASGSEVVPADYDVAIGDIAADATGTLVTLDAGDRPGADVTVTDAAGQGWTITAATGAVTASGGALAAYAGRAFDDPASFETGSYALASGGVARLAGRVIGTAFAPAVPVGALLTAAPDDIGGASWTTDATTPTVTARPAEVGVQPYRMVSDAFSERMQPTALVDTVVGETYVSVFVGKHVAGDRIGTGIRLESGSNLIRARVMDTISSGTPTYSHVISGGSPVESNFAGRAVALERLDDGFLRIAYYFTRLGINVNARTFPFWSTGGNANTVDGYYCGLFQMLRPAASAVAISDTEIALSLDADWSGWALGATVEYRVDAGSAVAVPEPGVTIITVAGPGTYTVERREVWPQASIPGVSPLMVGGGSSFSTQWAEV